MSESSPAVEPLYLGIADAASLLGIAYRTMRKLVDDGEVPAFRVGSARRVVVKRSDVLALLTPFVPNGGVS